MRDYSPSYLRRAATAGLVLCALAIGGSAAADDDPFGPEPTQPRGTPLQCSAGTHGGVDLQSRIAQIQRQIAAGGGLPEKGNAIQLNGSGYNYGGGGTHEVDQAALKFEAKQAR